LPPRWLAPLLWVLGVAASVLAWDLVRTEELARVGISIQRETRYVRDDLEDQLEQRILSIERIERAWEGGAGLSRAEFDDEARRLFAALPGLDAVRWFDPNLVSTWEVESHASGSDDQAFAAARRQAHDIDQLVVSEAARVGGRVVFAIEVPLKVQGMSEGGIEATFDLARTVDETVGDLGGDVLRIRDDTGTIYGPPPGVEGDWCRSTDMAAHGLPWRVEVCLPPDRVRAEVGPLPLLAGGTGIAVSTLVAALVHAVRQVRSRALEVEAASERVASVNRSLLRREAELEAADREVRELASTIAHDLRSPLRAMDGYSRMVREEYGERLDARALGWLDRVGANARRLGRLIDDLLNLPRIARVELCRQPVDLSSLVQDELAELSASEPGRRVEATVADNLRVVGDPALLALLVHHVVGNAWKFTRSREPARIDVGRDADGWVYVRDNGVGFDMAYSDHLFRPFERLHGDDYEGTGIGLALVARIVQRHGGEVRMEGEPGRGATLRFRLG
jgi:signal transduction histidine kinase